MKRGHCVGHKLQGFGGTELQGWSVWKEVRGCAVLVAAGSIQL